MISLNELINYKYIVASIVYSVLGILILLIAFWIIEKITPENLYKEIVEEHNIALAIVCAAFMIAVAIIISSSIHG
jgi:putative membrane protein